MILAAEHSFGIHVWSGNSRDACSVPGIIILGIFALQAVMGEKRIRLHPDGTLLRELSAGIGE
ncbi:hypothetical protein ALO_05278 [Acetonema longum DSM 6540]|uniref:Uncharacterized protein n=1 Tax=Acetonema longum DSM 6540 TaxID=1009370 RepID=F7NG69_9FIRM|nr:hypothetical protein ALO_05278 [Acetonema longum DSM 6540]